MTNLAKMIGAFILPAAALSGLGLAASRAAGEADAPPPLQCQITVEKGRFGHTYTGVLKADATVQGYYELNLQQRTGGFSVISQSGEFRVKAGETRSLGQATFGSGDPASVEAELILHIDGQTYACGTQTDL